VDLSKLTPDEFADKIVDKLEKSDVLLVTTTHYSYSDAARADVDFPIRDGDEVSELITALRTHNWYTQSPAIDKIFKLDWRKRTPDEAFVLGRNVYQCADGGERHAKAIMTDLRRELARLPNDWGEHILNGMFYEAYFDHEGKFRGTKLKSSFLSELFALETVARFERSIAYIQYILDPYRGSLGVLPNQTPEILQIEVRIEEKDPPLVTSIKAQGKEQLVTIADHEYDPGWRFSYRGFTLDTFPEELMRFWNIPKGHLGIKFDKNLPSTAKVRLPERKTLGSLRV
jgi:hypothetical protein